MVLLQGLGVHGCFDVQFYVVSLTVSSVVSLYWFVSGFCVSYTILPRIKFADFKKKKKKTILCPQILI